MTKMAAFSANQIAQLTASLTGGEPKRSATKADAVAKFERALVAKLGDALAKTYASEIMNAADLATAESWIATATEKLDAAGEDMEVPTFMKRKPITLAKVEAPTENELAAVAKPFAAKAKAKIEAVEAKREAAKAGKRANTKQAQVIAMLERPEGATLTEIVAATDWQAHTVRGAIAGAIKKKLGLNVQTEKVEGRGNVYRIQA